ncbi:MULTISPECIES: response regulator transcription factor [Pseudanabaena]|uniref:response regulator transcription factor n=1 Tax=Pseudanabaena TaxID=1152 RepID=UPI002479DC2E|nr:MULTISPECIES: response regulator [Pseudanabaena]MEA5485503.1 response regulator [Pseudanabaena sp. CCNP1317]WGS70642.1 response regulator [Pseudanabaena galeata CCNP1313]
MTKVLVVEDTPSERELICEYLRQGGYSVVSACNGKEGLEKFESLQPNIVITDLVMPGMSGLEMCRAIKRVATTKVPVIACTSKDQDLDRMWALKQGVDIYLTKPFTKDDILQALRSLDLRG